MQFSTFPVPEQFIIYKTDNIFVFTNLKPVLEGHVLVVPIRVVQRLHDLSDSERAEFFTVLELTKCVMKDIVGTEAVQVTLQDGPAGGQTVPHMHAHVIPRRLPTTWTIPSQQPDDIRAQVSARYRNAFEKVKAKTSID